MKKSLLTIIGLLVCSSAFAQFNQGRILVGGTVGFQSQTIKLENDAGEVTLGKVTTISFSPQGGYFIIDNLAVGAGIAFTSVTDKPEGDNGKFKTSEFTFNPFARYYFGPGVFGQLGFGLGSSKDVDDDGATSVETKAGVFQWNLGAGYAIFLNDNIAIEPFIGYGNKTLSFDAPGDPKQKAGGLFLSVGVQAYLGSK